MNTRIHIAMADALAQLKTANVTGATAVIQRALAGQDAGARPGDATGRASGVRPRLQSGLGKVLQSLGALRADHARSNDSTRGPARHPPNPDGHDERFQMRSYRGTAGSIGFKLYVPEKQDREPALILMLHGCTQNPDDFARGTRMNWLADEFGFLVAYPHQPRSANAQGCWNWFDRRHQQRGSGEPAVLAGLAGELAAEFAIAPERVFAAGLSAGGAMADVLATTYPDVFAAVGVHSGLPHGAASDVMSAFQAMKGQGVAAAARSDGSPARKIIFHGAADATVHPSNGEQLLDRARIANPGSVAIASDTTSNGRQVSRTLIDADTGAALAEHWLIHGAGHAWSGGDRQGSYTDENGPDASREMVRFFLR